MMPFQVVTKILHTSNGLPKRNLDPLCALNIVQIVQFTKYRLRQWFNYSFRLLLNLTKANATVIGTSNNLI